MVKEDEVTFEEGRLGIWGGTLNLAGTQARLAPADRPFKLSARVEGVQVGSALATWTDKKVLTGRLDADVRLSGKGETADAIKRALDGTVEGKLADGVFHGKDLIARGHRAAGEGGPGTPAEGRRGRDAPRWASWSRSRSASREARRCCRSRSRSSSATPPCRCVARSGSTASWTFRSRWPCPRWRWRSCPAGGRSSQSPLPFTFTLKGKAWGPRLAGLDVKPAAKTLVETLGVQALGKALGLGGVAPAGQSAEAPSHSR